MSLHEIVNSPVFGVSITGMAYMVGLKLHDRWSWLHPLLVTSSGLILFLLLTRIPYTAYKTGGDWISLMLSPATVALGVPFYKNAKRIRKAFAAAAASITCGAAAGMLSAAFFVRLLGGSHSLMFTMMSKSVTTPIAIEVSKLLGGSPPLTAVMTVLTGLIGSMAGPAFLRGIGVRSDLSLATAMGTSSHGIGTARMIHESEFRGSVSGLAMTLSGVITSLLAVPVHLIFQ